MTVTANRGETVHLSMRLLDTQKRDVTWKYNGECWDCGLTLFEVRVQSGCLRVSACRQCCQFVLRFSDF